MGGKADPELVLHMEATEDWALALMQEVVDNQHLGTKVVMAGFLMRIFWTGILLGIDMQKKDSEWAREFVGK